MGDTRANKSAGEQWVCSVPARMGWGAALARDGLGRRDILAVDTATNPEREPGRAPPSGPRLLHESAQCS